MTEDVEVRLARLEEQLRGMQRALKLQAEEYKRRLGELNQSHKRLDKALQKNAETYMRGETAIGMFREINGKHDTHDDRLAKLERDQALNTSLLARLDTGLLWLSRLIVGAVILGALTAAWAILRKGP